MVYSSISDIYGSVAKVIIFKEGRRGWRIKDKSKKVEGKTDHNGNAESKTKPIPFAVRAVFVTE